MGQITIMTAGSFNARTNVESAEEGGHAAAIGRQMKFLNDMLPEAIQKDHKLHDDGVASSCGLRKKDIDACSL